MAVSLVLEYDIPKGKQAVKEYLQVTKKKIIPLCDKRSTKKTGLPERIFKPRRTEN